MIRVVPFLFLSAIALGQTIGPNLHPSSGPEMVLLPAPTGTLPGAFGSIWSGELWAFNDGPAAILVTPGPCRLTGSDSCSIELPPGRAVLIAPPGELDIKYTTLTTPGFNEHLPGFQQVHFSLRVRDLSRQAESAGTEIPVVREAEMLAGTAQLLNVPVDSRFRLTLRIFLHPRALQQTFMVRLWDLEPTAHPISERQITIQTPILPAIYTGFAAGQAMITDLIPSGLPLPSAIRVEIESRLVTTSQYWAYISVTNNETQQVTVITPQ